MFPFPSILFLSSEVLKALLKTRELYERWRLGDEGLELRSAEEQEWAATELRNSLRSIEWDLEDLDDTVQIVEKNPAKFRIDANDLATRKSFIQQTKDEVEQMKARSSAQSRQTSTARFPESSPVTEVSFQLMFGQLSYHAYFIIFRVPWMHSHCPVQPRKAVWCQGETPNIAGWPPVGRPLMPPAVLLEVALLPHRN